ncbi:MAG: hypothetical protein R3B07_15660 [Polyangiaceae bacterium]
MEDERFACRVCGLHCADPPWGADGQCPTFDICDCCGVQFGYEDSLPASARRYRDAWLRNSCEWFRAKSKPEDWSWERQQARVPRQFG